MKKQTRPPITKKNEGNIIYGSYHKNGQQEFVSVGSKQYIVGEIKRGIAMPIKDKAKVKALIKRNGAKGKESLLILRVLGTELTLKNRIERLLGEGDIATDFPHLVHAESENFAEVKMADCKGREDLTKLPLCTIDGQTAKDFDDAVCASEHGKNIVVTVAIADVSHYVKIGSALDEEAFARGTSLYYPGHCVPMLPENLSNGLCSLKPKVLRLALAVSFEIGPKGGISRTRIMEAVIKSKARLTYEQVQKFYENGKSSAADIPMPVQESLVLLKKAALILRKNREKRGAIDFDIVESVIALDDSGEPLSVAPEMRLESHRIIEDLMVATNEIVAQYFAAKKIPTIYRVHEPPNEEKLDNFYKTAKAFGAISGNKIKKGEEADPHVLQEVMRSYQKSTYKDSLNSLMLRAMMQARYSEKNLMHFGLASPAYLHFTSPIRRYADLIVHRQLRFAHFEHRPTKKRLPESLVAEIADSISQKELRATDLERKIARLFAATFMASRVGESFDAVIVACIEFGLFVRVMAHHIEGLVHIASISSSHVNFVPEKMSLVVSGSNKKYMVGDKVRVKLINVNLERGHIDFELEQTDERKKTTKQRRRR